MIVRRESDTTSHLPGTEVKQEVGGYRGQTGNWGIQTEVRQEDGGYRPRSDRKLGDTDRGQTGSWGIETEVRQEAGG